MFKDENRHYSLRKLSVGLASVLIGISFFGVKTNTAYADSLKPVGTQTEVTNQKTSNANQDTTNSSKPEAKAENAQKQATATDEMVNKKQGDQVSRQVNEVNNTTSPEKSKVNTTESDANAQTKQRDEQTENILQIKPAKNPKPNALKQNLVAEAPESETVVKTRNDIDQNKLSASKWQFTDADDNNKAIAGATIIIGNSGDTFTKDQITLPKGYEDRNDLLGKNAATLKLPAAGTITTYTLPLSHHHTDLTKQAPEDEVEQTRSITVHYKYLDGDKANQEAVPDAKLDVYYSRNKFKDDVTGEISYTNWSWDKSQGDPEYPGYHIISGKWDNLPEQWDNVIANVPTIAGYTAILDEPNRPDNTNHVNANKFVHPLWNNSFGSGMTDMNKDSLAYLATNTLYEAKNEHTVYYKANDENTNDAFALDSKNGLHEHANVNDNGGYDTDYWGKINVDDWNYTVNGDRIEINGLKDGVSTGANDAVIVPNLDDFKLAGKDGGAKAVYISKNTLGKTAKHKYYGLSKTNGNKFVTDSDLNNAFDNSKLTYADLNSLDTNNVTNMSSMFSDSYLDSPSGTSLKSLDVSDWDTSNVTNMSNMFYNASSLNSLDVSNWDTSNVTNMSAMFEHTGLTSLDVSNWDTSNVTNMSNMFAFDRNLTSLDVSKWNTGNVTDMDSMFNDDSSLTNLDVSKWNTGKVTDMNSMFSDDSSLTNLDVSKWNTGKVTDMNSMFSGDGRLTSLDVSNWDTSNVTNMGSMFEGASSLMSLDVSKWNTGKVTDMNGMFGTDADPSSMFYGISSLTSLDVSNWDTSKVTNMNSMFSGDSRLTSLDVSKWDTSNVTDMGNIFCNASSLTSLDVSNWNTNNVTDMGGMFSGDSRLTSLDVSNWNTNNVTDMSGMFENASSLRSLDVSKWDTSKVTGMSGMFEGASSLTNLDVSKWDTSKVNFMSEMFENASSLTSLDVSKWNVGHVNDMGSMFKGASSLTSLDVSNWNPGEFAYIDYNYMFMLNMFDGASSLALIANSGKFVDYLVKNFPYSETNSVTYSKINSAVKSVTTDNTKLLQLLTNDVQHNPATRTIVFTFPTGYSPDLTKYHLTKNGNTYQIKQSADYDTSYAQGTVLINATEDITKHHIDTTKPYKLSDTWQPNYDKLVLAHKNADGTVSFDKVQLPKVPGYKAKIARNNGLLMVSYLVFAPEKPVTNNNLNELQFSNKLATDSAVQFNSTVKSNIVVKSDMYQVVNDDHNWQLPVIKSYDLKFATNKNQIIFAYTKDKQYNYRFVLTFKDGQYRLTTFNKQGKLLKTYSIKSYKKLVKIIHSLVSMDIA